MALSARRVVSLLAVLTVLSSAAGLHAWTPARRTAPCRAARRNPTALPGCRLVVLRPHGLARHGHAVARRHLGRGPAARGRGSGQAAVRTTGRILPSASDALDLALLQATHDPPYLSTSSC